MKKSELQSLAFKLLYSYRCADFAQSVHGVVSVWENESELEHGSFLPSFAVDFFDEAGELAQRGVHPCVDLQLVRRHLASGIVARRVVSHVRQEHAQ